MRRSCARLAVFMAGGILLGPCAFRSVADESNAAELVAPAKMEQEIRRLIDQLGSKRFQDREQAARELSRLGTPALASLKEASKSSDAEVRRRAQQLIERMAPPAQSIEPRPEPVTTPGKSYL